MKLALALTLVLAACGSKPKPESPIVPEGSGAETPETCCCKTHPLAAEDGKPVFAMTNRMECSTQQGECQPDVQCAASPGA